MTDDEEFTDIVELLRSDDRHEYCSDAAKEIERLRKALEKASDALHDAGLHDAWADARKTLEGI